MTAAFERRLNVIERRMGVDTSPLADFSDADLLAAIEWAITTLGDAGSETVAREDAEEARLKTRYMRPDGTSMVDVEERWRWPYQRAHAHQWERSHPYPPSAATSEELQRKIDAAMAATRRTS